jgi:uncharacterized membrane protein YfcA
LGAHLAIGAREHTLRRAVGAFLLAVAVLYGVDELVSLLGDGG